MTHHIGLKYSQTGFFQIWKVIVAATVLSIFVIILRQTAEIQCSRYKIIYQEYALAGYRYKTLLATPASGPCFVFLPKMQYIGVAAGMSQKVIQ